MSRFSTFLLIAGALALVFTLAAVATGTLSFIWNLEAIATVVAGSFLAASAGTSPSTIKDAINALLMLSRHKTDVVRTVEWWIELNKRWRSDGIRSITDAIDHAPSATAVTIAHLCADGFDAETIEKLAHQYVETMYRQREATIAFYRRLAGFAPTMGIIGTVIGLASALANGGDNPTILLQRIGFAFSATLWGLVTANFIYLPIAHRLQSHLEEERLLDRLHLEAASLVARGTTPILTRYMLAMRVPDPYRKIIIQH